jgi:hypothetical protein
VQRFPARDIAAHYVQRWEIELGFREIKQGMLKKAATLRSKLPELVRQEVWGMLIAYNLYHWPLQTPGTFPKRLALLREQSRAYLLPERRARSYPRAVKPPRFKYPTKNASQLN